jgi:serine/threonine-protein kinase
MGRVWVALDASAPALRLVALKTTLGGSDAGMNDDFWAILTDEAALASRIHHPNVCATHELGQEGSVHFLVMEWSDGSSLRDVLNASPGKRISPELCAYIGSSVAAGLHAAHELTDDEGHLLGVVHRDVSPQNILISTQGHVRLADFGVAKSRGQLHRPTETGEVKGKLSYMAPEQVTSKTVDRRADVFALGCVLYEAALGVRPFHGADALATMYKILEEELVPPRGLDPNFPEALERVLLKALSKDTKDRYQTAEELREALVEYLSSSGRFFMHKHVAELVSQTLGGELKERNRAIFASAEQLRKGEIDPSRLDSPRPPLPTQTLTPEGVERSVELARTPPKRRTRIGLLLAATAALGVVLVIAGSRSRGPTEAPGSSPAGVSVAAASTAPVPAELAPTVAAVAEAPASGSISATPDAPTVAAPGRTPGATVGRGTRVGSRPPVAATSSSTAPTSAKPTAKKPRPIDRDNPFAAPSP